LKSLKEPWNNIAQFKLQNECNIVLIMPNTNINQWLDMFLETREAWVALIVVHEGNHSSSIETKIGKWWRKLICDQNFLIETFPFIWNHVRNMSLHVFTRNILVFTHVAIKVWPIKTILISTLHSYNSYH